MKVAVMDGWGADSMFSVSETNIPTIKSDEVLVEVCASSINPVDWKVHKVLSYLPNNGGIIKPIIAGSDLAGKVIEVGSKVSDFSVGDEVYGMKIYSGAYSEYVAIKAKVITKKPRNLNFAEAAAIPLAGLTAIQGLQAANINSESKIFVIGASGGVGSLIVQLAKALGAEVTAVCSGKNVDLVKTLGADEVIDYSTTDYMCDPNYQKHEFDLVYDTVGLQCLENCKHFLKPNGFYATIWPNFSSAFEIARSFIFRSGQRSIFPGVLPSKRDLEELTRYIESEKLKPILDRELSLEDLNEGMSLSKSKRTVGKIVINLKDKQPI